MPVYDYACTQCGRTIEVTHGVHAHGPSACEACGGPMRKLLSSPAIVFKGSGWAKKDAQAASRARSSGGRSSGHAKTSTDVAPKESAGSSSGGDGSTASSPASGGSSSGGAASSGAPSKD
ncbi:MAG: FmdB family transcriptional regulator [Chloroflexi bacterium]|nr:FmdB family transcriptional regulator [Chloroflexota bacterium]